MKKSFDDILEYALRTLEAPIKREAVNRNYSFDAGELGIISDMTQSEYDTWLNAGCPPFQEFITIQLWNGGVLVF